MSEKLKKLKPIIHRVGVDPIPDSGFRNVTTQVPAKIVTNTRDNMELLDMYVRGSLKWNDTGRVCGECMHWYPDPKAPLGGRCKMFGFKQTHRDTPADDTKNWTHPVTKETFKLWPGCPEFSSKSRLSRR